MTLSVAIVEDDAEMRGILCGWIERSPEFVLACQAPDAETALTLLPGHTPNVVLMDINLPGLSGVEAVRRLKPLLPATQFVMFTVYEDADHIFDALAAGATGYLLKDTPRAEVLAALQEVHAGGSPMNSSIARKVVQSFKQHPAPPSPEPLDLSPRETDVLGLLARGFLYKEIADELDISVPTVNTYIRRIYDKLHVRTRTEAVARFVQRPR